MRPVSGMLYEERAETGSKMATSPDPLSSIYLVTYLTFQLSKEKLSFAQFQGSNMWLRKLSWRGPGTRLFFMLF